MLVYSLIILFFMTLITIFNSFLNPTLDKWYLYALATIIYTVLVILIDAIVAIIGRALPEKWINKDRRLYRTGKREKEFFNLIKVKKWKDHVPELGGFTSFHKDKIENPKDKAYLERFILEARYGIFIHYVSSPCSFLLMLLDYKHYYLNITIALPVAIVNAVLILLPAFILKYNLPKLEFVLRKVKDKEERESQVMQEA